MPEGPELHIAARFVNRVSAGRVFTGKVKKSEVSTKSPEVDWNEETYSISATSRGKEIRLTLTGVDPSEAKKGGNGKAAGTKGKSKPKSFVAKTMDILFRFGMSGKFEFQSKDNMEKHSHLNFYTKEDGMVLSFVDYRRFGRWEITSDWGPKRGPCIITEYPSFREKVLTSLNKPVFKRPICEALLDQEYFNGMGNYLRAEALFRRKIPPFVSALSVLETIKEDEENGVKSEEPDLLQLCNILATEVVNLNQGEGYFYDPTKKESLFQNFLNWLQCYYKPDMQNLVDHNGRTIWFTGQAGPLAPKEKKSRERKKRSKKTCRSGTADSEEPEPVEMKKAKMTRNKLATDKKEAVFKTPTKKSRKAKTVSAKSKGKIKEIKSENDTASTKNPGRKSARLTTRSKSR